MSRGWDHPADVIEDLQDRLAGAEREAGELRWRHQFGNSVDPWERESIWHEAQYQAEINRRLRADVEHRVPKLCIHNASNARKTWMGYTVSVLEESGFRRIDFASLVDAGRWMKKHKAGTCDGPWRTGGLVTGWVGSGWWTYSHPHRVQVVPLP